MSNSQITMSARAMGDDGDDDDDNGDGDDDDVEAVTVAVAVAVSVVVSGVVEYSSKRDWQRNSRQRQVHTLTNVEGVVGVKVVEEVEVVDGEGGVMEIAATAAPTASNDDDDDDAVPPPPCTRQCGGGRC
jgi:hypothetical protein